MTPASKLELTKQQVVLNSCKICGGKPLADELGGLPESMLSNTGIELSAVIDPQLNWKSTSKGKSRAIRRARTSFLNTTKSKSVGNGLKPSENIIIKESRTRDMSDFESEKLGVTILGRHFSDTITNVPIKKRRFVFRSPSPPLHSPFLTDVSEHVEVSQVVSSWNGIAQNSKIRHNKLETTTALVQGIESKNVGDDKCDVNDTEKADFSGIFILAAACSGASDECTISESSVSKGDSFKMDGSLGIPISYSGDRNKIVEGQQLDTADATLVKTDTLLYSKEEDHTNVPSSHLQDFSCSLSNVPDKTTGNSTRMGSSLRDDRFHWDLNTVMDSWESPCDGVISDWQPVASHAVGEDSSHHGVMLDKQEPCDMKIVEVDSLPAVKSMDKKVDLGRLSLHERGRMDLAKSDLSCNRVIVDLEDCSARERQEACFVSVTMAENTAESNTLNNQEASSFMMELQSFPAGHVPDPVSICPSNSCASENEEAEHAPDPVSKRPSSNSCASEKEEASTHGTRVEAVAGKILHPIEYALAEHPIIISEPHSALDKTSGETVTGEKTFDGSEAILHMHSENCCLADAQVMTTMQAREPVLVCPDQDTVQLNECYSGSIGEQVSGILVCGYHCKMDSDGETHDDVGQTQHLNETSNMIIQSDEAGECTHLVSCGLSDHKETTNGFMSNDDYMNAEEDGFPGSRSVLTYPDRSRGKSEHHVHARSKNLMIPSEADECALMDAAYDAQNGYGGNPVKNDLVNALKDHFNHDFYSNASKSEEAVQLEVGHQGDINSQYEDGEFRESFVHDWGVDASDDVEAEHVDYGSDDKEIDAFEAPDDPAVSSFECENKELSVGHCGENHDDQQETVFSHLHSSITSVPGIETAGADGAMVNVLRSRHSRGKLLKELGKNTKNELESGALTGKVMQDGEFTSEDDRARESCYPASFGRKSSGWDQFPEGLRKPGDTLVDSGVDSSGINHDSIPYSGYGAGESSKMAESMLRQTLSSQIERSKFNDISQRKETAYSQRTRNCNHSNDIRHSAERDAKLGRSDRGDRSSVHMHRKSRGDNWFKSSSHSAPNCRSSPGYYSAASFTHLGGKDAAAVSIAKVVSNGFAVAPDGTVVEARALSHLPRQSADSSLHIISCTPRRDEMVSRNRQLDLDPIGERGSGKRISTFRGRSCRYGPRMVSAERYHRVMPDNNIGSSLPVHRPFSHREQSFSPERRPVQVSRSHLRSRSRSRTRSPHMWGSARRTRSPANFRSELTFERIKSPRRSGSAEHRPGFVPSSENCTSPAHASRWIGDRKFSAGHYRDHECRSSRRGATSARLLSQRRRFDPVDCQKMAKHDKFYGPMHSGRFLELDVDKGPRLDAIDDDGRCGDGYEMFPSARQCGLLGDVNEDAFTSQKDCYEGVRKFFRRGGSPRRFQRRVASQDRDSPPRHVDKGHLGHGRGEKESRSFKSCRQPS